MASLPVGPAITFLFTDIEGSTRLERTVGGATWAAVVADHDARLREAIEAAGGHVVKTEGDAVFAAFADPRGALRLQKGVMVAPSRVLHLPHAEDLAVERLGPERTRDLLAEGAAIPVLRMVEMILAASPPAGSPPAAAPAAAVPTA